MTKSPASDVSPQQHGKFCTKKDECATPERRTHIGRSKFQDSPPSTLALHCASAGQLAPAGGDRIEASIDSAWLRLCTAKNPDERRVAISVLNSLVKQRDEKRVAQMEIERGLR